VEFDNIILTNINEESLKKENEKITIEHSDVVKNLKVNN